MKIAIVKETKEHEKRVAASPETVRKLIALGANVAIEEDAGLNAAITNEMYTSAGAEISSADNIYRAADILLCVQAPSPDNVKKMKKGTLLIGMLSPYQDKDGLNAYATAGIDAFSMEFVPRITRAQTMDVLSSQANLAGYRAVLEAAYVYGCGFPLMMTAAGTVPPARVFVMGAGVAGLQAIATAKRLGAQVSATDVRIAAKEQVQSLGGTFIMVEDEETKAAETSGGYAKEMSDAYKKKQAELIAETIKKQDIVITTALIPGRPAPVLVTAEMVKTMKHGSIIVDLAVEQGGNCAGSEIGRIAEINGVKIIGFPNLPSRIAVDASALYARNLLAFLTPMIDTATKSLKINHEDEIVKATQLTSGGKIIHAQFAKDAAA